METTPANCVTCGSPEVIRVPRKDGKPDNVRWACGVWSDVKQPSVFADKHTCPYIKSLGV